MRILLALAMLLVVAACSSADVGDDTAGGATRAAAPQVPDGLTVTRLVDGLAGPTQMIIGPDDRLWVAQLNGGENESLGQVVAVDLDSGQREVLVEGLDKPTGIAWLDESLWIATRDAVLRAPADALDAPDPVITDLPNNGRSQGTLTPTPDGTLLYETSGRERQGGGSVDGSGTLWELDPAAPDDPRAVATGFKNAYAHVFDDGDLWVTEIAEPIDGVSWPDELNRVTPGADHGWPACAGDGRPVEAFGGDAARCRDVVTPAVTFDPGATPTSIVANPFSESEFVVALWNTGEVVSVPADGSAPPEPFVQGLPRPQHLLVDGDGLLVVDHERGEVHRITAVRA